MLDITSGILRYAIENVLQPGSDTPMLARFSSMADDIGVADTERDERCLF